MRVRRLRKSLWFVDASRGNFDSPLKLFLTFDWGWFRDGVDNKCTYHNSSDWVRSTVSGMGYCSAWLGGWSSGNATLLFCQLLHFYSPRFLLPLRGPCHRQEKLHLHGRYPLKPR